MAEQPANPAITTANSVIDTEIAGLNAIKLALLGDQSSGFMACLNILSEAAGRIIITGMGKSGHVGRKIAATFASTGAPSLFVHPAEASHGDLGMIASQDVVLALSKSGETSELRDLLGYTARFNIKLVAITEGADSTLAKAADAAFILPDMTEACCETNAPTTSTTAMMALGDALAVSLMRMKGVTSTDFHGFHPGGKLGAALRRVETLMHRHCNDSPLPLCHESVSLKEAIVGLDEGGFGCVGLTNDQGVLTGILTDGDVRRLFGRGSLDQPASNVMTRKPRTVTADMLAGDALSLMSDGKITSLFVLQSDKPIGLLHIHDCLAAGVV